MSALAIALLSAVLFGAATPASKALLRDLHPLALAGWLYVGAAAATAIGSARDAHGRRMGRREPARSGDPDGPPPGGTYAATRTRDRRRLAAAVLFGGILGPILVLLGLRLAAAGTVSLWLNFEFVATAVLGHLLFRDHLGRFGWVGVAGVLGAGVLLTGTGGSEAGWSAAGLVALGCLCWGIDNHLTAVIETRTAQEITFWKGLAAGACNLALAAIAGAFSLRVPAVLAAVVTGAAAYGASIVLYIRAARQLGATRAQAVFASAPFFGLVLSALFLREAIGLRHLAAAGLLAGSVAILLIDRFVHDHTHTHAPIEHDHAHAHEDGHHTHVHPDLPHAARHSHRHTHEPIVHAHAHWPDLHHRHDHESD